MLLRHLYNFAISKKLLENLAFEEKSVKWIIELDSNGIFLGCSSTGDEKKTKKFSCPKTSRSKNGGGVAEFLADGITALFGLEPEPEKERTPNQKAKQEVNNLQKHQEFWKLIEEAFHYTHNPALSAVLQFKTKYLNGVPFFIRYGFSKKEEQGNKCWWIASASEIETKLGSDNFTFRVNGELLLENSQICAFWEEMHAKEVNVSKESAKYGICLVSGKNNKPLARTHTPKIQGVLGTNSTGASLVSYDKPAYSSYGFEQSLNATTSIEASTAYCKSLNYLLKSERNHINMGNTSLCFWTDYSDYNFFQMLDQPDPGSIAEFIKSPWKGIERELAMKEQFYTVTLAGNAGRIIVRDWLQQPLEAAVENLKKWFEDLEIRCCTPSSDKKKQPLWEKPPLAIYRLAGTTVRENKGILSETISQLYRAALSGTIPSLSLLKLIIRQLRNKLVSSDKYNILYDESRFALIKLIINRNRKENQMEIMPELTADTNDPAYNCGRLLAVFDELQKNAHDWKLEGPTVAEKYFSSASTAPSTAFGILWRLHVHHLRKVGEKAKIYERKICEICRQFEQSDEMKEKKLPPLFPRTLDIQSQGRFALGFYQQKYSDYTTRQALKTLKQEQNK